MPLRDDILAPIPGDNPGGADLRYDPLYDRIKDARREDDDAPQGEWTRQRKTADWPQVIKLAGDAIATKTKDLQLAAWLTEALLKREGLAGLREGVGLLRALVAEFWDHLYPEIDDGDAEMRAAPLDWVGLKLEVAVKQAPLTRAGHSLLDYRDSRAVGYEADTENDSDRAEARQKLIAEGKLTGEEWDRAFDATPKAWYRALVADLAATFETIDALDADGREKFGDVAPSYNKLRDALGEVQRLADQLLALKLQKEPDPVEATPADGGGPGTALVASGEPGSAPAGAARGGALAPEPQSREDAAGRLAGVARYLRRHEPTNPAAYLMLRGFRWGELRATGAEPDPRLLEAPPTQVRTQLKALLLDARWEDLLEAAETVMATPFGRGWIDLQRYTIAATDGLGADYVPVGSAILGALRALLADVPALPELTLMDDTPTCNAETRAWLRKSVLAGGAAAALAPSDDDEPAAPRPGNGAAPDPYPRALAEARAGRPERGVEMLSRALANEKSRRGRFVRQTQMAAVMVEAGLEHVARPILEDLDKQVTEFKLEDWESPDVVARPLALLWRVIDRLEGETEAKHALYLRVCRLDPLAAMGFGSSGSAEAVSSDSSESEYESAVEE